MDEQGARMSKGMKKACVMAVALALAACGGGGGGGGSSGGSVAVGGGASATGSVPAPVAASQSWLTLTPSSAQMTVYENLPEYFTVDVTSTRALPDPVNAAIIDRNGVIAQDIGIMRNGPAGYVATLRTSPTLKAGAYETQLELRLCEDDPLVCAKPLSGSPWQFPLKVTVKPSTNLTPLTASAGLGAWNGLSGNAANNAFVPLDLDPKAFSMRWILGRASGMPGLNAIGEGVALFVDTHTTNNTQLFELVGISEETGKELYRVSLPDATDIVGAPSIADGKIYTLVSKPSKTFRYTLDRVAQIHDLKTGSLLGSTVYETGSTPETSTPVFTPTGIYMTGYDSISRFRPADFTRVWQTTFATTTYLRPVADEQYVYGARNRLLHVYDAASGAGVFSIADDAAGTGGVMSLVLAGKQVAVQNNDSVRVFDTEKRSLLWTQPAARVPVFANGALYVSAQGRLPNLMDLHVHDAATGKLLWAYEDLDPTVGGLIVTNKLAFVSSPSATIAIDLASHKRVWSIPQGGPLKLSDRGVLYITPPDGKAILAINLR
jgi:hypothetical protein